MKPYYQHAGITIYHGDCRELLMQLGRVDVVLTDPPYGILNFAGVGSGKLKDRLLNRSDVQWDIAPTEADFDLMRDRSDVQIFWGGNYFLLPPARGILVWDKQQPWESFSQVEIAWTNLDRPAAIFRESGTLGTPNKVHPTQKPISLMKWCVSMTEGEVLDPYMGSGTTLLAAKDSGRSAIGIEIEEKYCEIAAKRLSHEVFHFMEGNRDERI